MPVDGKWVETGGNPAEAWTKDQAFPSPQNMIYGFHRSSEGWVNTRWSHLQDIWEEKYQIIWSYPSTMPLEDKKELSEPLSATALTQI